MIIRSHFRCEDVMDGGDTTAERGYDGSERGREESQDSQSRNADCDLPGNTNYLPAGALNFMIRTGNMDGDVLPSATSPRGTSSLSPGFPPWAWIGSVRIFCAPFKSHSRRRARGVNPQLFGHCVLTVRRPPPPSFWRMPLLTYFIVGQRSVFQEWSSFSVLYKSSLRRVRAWFKSVAMVGQSSKQKEEERGREREVGRRRRQR